MIPQMSEKGLTRHEEAVPDDILSKEELNFTEELLEAVVDTIKTGTDLEEAFERLIVKYRKEDTNVCDKP